MQGAADPHRLRDDVLDRRPGPVPGWQFAYREGRARRARPCRVCGGPVRLLPLVMGSGTNGIGLPPRPRRYTRSCDVGRSAQRRSSPLAAGCWSRLAVAASRSRAVTDPDGRPVAPLAGPAPATVLLFTAVDCPISDRYAPEVRRLAARFGAAGVRFWLVYANAGELPAAVRDARRRLRLRPAGGARPGRPRSPTGPGAR